MNKVSIIYGVTGQVGSYLLPALLARGDYVYGVARRTSLPNTARIKKYLDHPNFCLCGGDITDVGSVFNTIDEVSRTYSLCHGDDLEIYNLAAQSHVHTSFTQPSLTWDVTAKGHLNILEAAKFLKSQDFSCNPKVFFMASSEMFGSCVDDDGYQRETTRMEPNSPYACAKLAAFNLNKIYRKYGIDTRSGIIFNTESPRRGEEFVTRKITRFFGHYLSGRNNGEKLKLGNLNAKRDWNHAEDTVDGIIKIMSHSEPDDFILSSGKTHTVQEFLKGCYDYCKKHEPQFMSETLLENLYEYDSRLERPVEVKYLNGNSSKAREVLGWHPKHTFESIIEDMMRSDILLAE